MTKMNTAKYGSLSAPRGSTGSMESFVKLQIGRAFLMASMFPRDRGIPEMLILHSQLFFCARMPMSFCWTLQYGLHIETVFAVTQQTCAGIERTLTAATNAINGWISPYFPPLRLREYHTFPRCDFVNISIKAFNAE